MHPGSNVRRERSKQEPSKERLSQWTPDRMIAGLDISCFCIHQFSIPQTFPTLDEARNPTAEPLI